VDRAGLLGGVIHKKESLWKTKRLTKEQQGGWRRKLDFIFHLAVYVGVNILLIVINLVTAPRHLWFIWPLIGWGIGVFFHGMSTFFFTGRKFQEIKDRMIQEEIKRESR